LQVTCSGKSITLPSAHQNKYQWDKTHHHDDERAPASGPAAGGGGAFVRSGLTRTTTDKQKHEVPDKHQNRGQDKVFYLTQFFMTTKDVPTDIDKRVEWVKVDKDVNELDLKSP